MDYDLIAPSFVTSLSSAKLRRRNSRSAPSRSRAHAFLLSASCVSFFSCAAQAARAANSWLVIGDPASNRYSKAWPARRQPPAMGSPEPLNAAPEQPMPPAALLG